MTRDSCPDVGNFDGHPSFDLDCGCTRLNDQARWKLGDKLHPFCRIAVDTCKDLCKYHFGPRGRSTDLRCMN